MSQRPKKPKPAAEMTSEEAIAHLFHPKVVEHAKRHVREADKPLPNLPKPSPESMNEE
jgi:hypothetical protein